MGIINTINECSGLIFMMFIFLVFASTTSLLHKNIITVFMMILLGLISTALLISSIVGATLLFNIFAVAAYIYAIICVILIIVDMFIMTVYMLFK